MTTLPSSSSSLGDRNTPKTTTESHRNEFPGEISKRGTSSPITRTGVGVNPAAGLEKEVGLGEVAGCALLRSAERRESLEFAAGPKQCRAPG